MGIASAIIFVGMLYFAFTYSAWDWWVVLVLVLSFIGMGSSEWVKFRHTNETHNHYEEKRT